MAKRAAGEDHDGRPEPGQSAHVVLQPTMRAQMVGASITLAAALAAVSMTRPQLPLLLTALGVTEAGIGALAALFAVMPLLMAIPCGAWIDRVGPGIPAMVGSAGIAASMAIVAAAPAAGSVALSQLLAGQSQLLVVLSAQVAATATSSGRQLDRNVGLLLACAAAAHLVGPATGGMVAGRAGTPAVFAWSAAMGLVALAAAAVLHGLERRSGSFGHPCRRRQPVLSGFGEALRWVRGEGAMKAAVVVTLGVVLGETARQVFLPLQLASRSFGPGVVGTVASASGLGSLAVRPATALLVKALGSRWALAVASLFGAGLCALASSRALSVPGYATVAFGWGAASGAWPAVATTILSERYGPGRRALALSVRLTANQVAEVLGPVALGLVAGRGGPDAALATAGALLLAEAVALHRYAAGVRPVPPPGR